MHTAALHVLLMQCTSLSAMQQQNIVHVSVLCIHELD